LNYFSYPIAKVDIALLPWTAEGILPNGASQTITATAYDQLEHRKPGILLTFSTTSGSFPDDGKTTAGLTDSNGETKVTVSSSIPGSAILTAWTDYDKDGFVDPGEWSTTSDIIWKLPQIALSPGTATKKILDGTSQDFTANVVDKGSGMVINGIPVLFSIDLGSFADKTKVTGVTTNKNGQALVTVIPPADTGTATVWAWIDTNGDQTRNALEPQTYSTMIWEASPKPATIDLAASPATITLPDTTPVPLTATVHDQYNELMPNTQVKFTIAFNDGTNTVTTETTVPTGSDGIARTTLSETTPGTATITATSGDAKSKDPSTVTWLAAPKASTIDLAASPATITLPDTTPVSLTATVTSQYMKLMPGTDVTFTIDFHDGTATTSTSTTVTTGSDGVARTTLSETTAGTATITATAGDAKSDSSTVTWLPEILRPADVTVTPPAATNQLPGATTQILMAMVSDQHGKPMDNTEVTFTTDFGSLDGGGNTATVPTLNGVATITISSTGAGTAHITATDGDATPGASTITWEET
jgi:adhesin/invasin